MPGAPATEYGVYHFRRTFELAAKPERFVVHVSGDNRYQLFVNGRRVAWGPARGDLFHWRYETVDAAPYLEPGKNVFAAVVWNFGELAPEAQVTFETGFLVDGDTPAESVVNTGTRLEMRARRILFAGAGRRGARLFRGGAGRPGGRPAAPMGLGRQGV